MIPEPADQIAKRKRRGIHGGRPPTLDHEAYKQRNTVERSINKLKQWRGLATPYDKTATMYLVALEVQPQPLLRGLPPTDLPHGSLPPPAMTFQSHSKARLVRAPRRV